MSCASACMDTSWGCDASCYDSRLRMETQLLNFLNDASVVSYSLVIILTWT